MFSFLFRGVESFFKICRVHIQPTILDKIDGKFVPPPHPNQGWENGAFWLLRSFILDLGGWGFAVPFHSVQDCS